MASSSANPSRDSNSLASVSIGSDNVILPPVVVLIISHQTWSPQMLMHRWANQLVSQQASEKTVLPGHAPAQDLMTTPSERPPQIPAPGHKPLPGTSSANVTSSRSAGHRMLSASAELAGRPLPASANASARLGWRFLGQLLSQSVGLNGSRPG